MTAGSSSAVTVLHFTEAGDTSGYFPQLAAWHDSRRFRMIFGTLKNPPGYLCDAMARHGVECFSCGSRGRADYALTLGRLIRFLRERQVDLVHTHLFDPSVVGLVGASIACTPVRVLTRHYSDYHTRIEKRWHVRLDQLTTRLAHAVIAVSAHTADHLRSAEGAPPAKVHVIPNGIDFDRVRPADPAAAGSLRAEFSPNGEVLILVPARLHPEKGHSYLFRALPALRAASSRAFVVLLAGDGPYRAAYEEEIRGLGCLDLVRFLGYRSDLPALMSVADLVVLPSVAEAFGLALAEALSLGIPVVASRVGGVPEIVDDGLDGVLVPPADPGALSAAIGRLLSDPSSMRALAGAGREKVRQRFSFERMMRAYEDLYDRLLPG